MKHHQVKGFKNSQGHITNIGLIYKGKHHIYCDVLSCPFTCRVDKTKLSLCLVFRCTFHGTTFCIYHTESALNWNTEYKNMSKLFKGGIIWDIRREGACKLMSAGVSLQRRHSSWVRIYIMNRRKNISITECYKEKFSLTKQHFGINMPL